MTATIFRTVKGQLHIKGSSVIEDRGYLRKVSRDSQHNYLFSEAGVGVEDLVLLGTRTDIMVWLGINYKNSIHNVNKI